MRWSRGRDTEEIAAEEWKRRRRPAEPPAANTCKTGVKPHVQSILIGARRYRTLLNGTFTSSYEDTCMWFRSIAIQAIIAEAPWKTGGGLAMTITKDRR